MIPRHCVDSKSGCIGQVMGRLLMVQDNALMTEAAHNMRLLPAHIRRKYSLLCSHLIKMLFIIAYFYCFHQ